MKRLVPVMVKGEQPFPGGEWLNASASCPAGDEAARVACMDSLEAFIAAQQPEGTRLVGLEGWWMAETGTAEGAVYSPRNVKLYERWPPAAGQDVRIFDCAYAFEKIEEADECQVIEKGVAA